MKVDLRKRDEATDCERRRQIRRLFWHSSWRERVEIIIAVLRVRARRRHGE